MKKAYLLLMVMVTMLARYVCAGPLLTPDPAKSYYIVHSSGYLFTKDGTAAKIMSPGSGTCQKFKFIPVAVAEDTYNIQCEDDTYVGSDGSYTVKFLTDPSDKYAQFKFWEGSEVDHVKMWNEGRGGYFGTDYNNDGSGVYSDKSGTDGKHAWRFMEATDGVNTMVLHAAIEDAEAFLNATPVDELFTTAANTALTSAIAKGRVALASSDQEAVNAATAELKTFLNSMSLLLDWLRYDRSICDNAEIGERTGAYPASAVAALKSAIDDAVAKWAEADASVYDEAITALSNAASAFSSARYAFVPEEGKEYIFINTYNNFALGINASGAAALAIVTGDENQKFELIGVNGSHTTFNFKIADGTGYLASSGSWNSTTLADPDADAAKLTLGVVDIDKRIYTINRLNYGGAWASDSNNEGSLVYTNKAQNLANAQWQIVQINSGEVIMVGLESAIALAEQYLAGAEAGEKPGCYPQSAIDALAAALGSAKAADPKTQQEANDAAAALNAAIKAFIAEKIDPFFVPEADTAYRISVRKYESNYATAADAKIGTSSFEAGKTLQHWTFQPVADAKYTYILKNGGKVLNYDGSMSETSDEEAPKWTVVYTQTVENLPYFAIVEYENPAKVMTFGSGKNFVIQDLSVTNNAHQTRIMRVDMPNDPNVDGLEKAVANARASLAGVERGTEVGQYSPSACDALAAVIDEIDARRGLTQSEVNEAVIELNMAVSDFLLNPATINKEELLAAIKEGKEKAAAAVIGINVGEYYPSEITAFEEKLASFETKSKSVADQDECDALTQEVKDAVAAFAGNTEVQPVADVLSDAIAWCETLYNAEKDNVGDDMGQRTQATVDAFAAAIAAAKALTTPTESDLKALLDARTAFINTIVVTNRKALRAAIAEAEGDEFVNLTAGEFDGNYPQDAIDAFAAALANAKAADADKTKSQDELDAAAKSLNDAMANLRKSKVVINFADLDSAITSAESALAKVTQIGSEDGKCPQNVYDALNREITMAKAVTRASVTQTSVDEMATSLFNATAKFNEELVKSTGISDAIMSAQGMLDGATQGFKPGNYPVSAMDGLREAIRTALEVSLDNASTQAQLLDARKALEDAVETFKSLVVPAHDLTSIKEAIADAEAFIAQYGNGDYVLALALEDAKAVVANPNDYTKSEVDKADTALRKALQYAKDVAGVEDMTTGNVMIGAAAGRIMVKGVKEGDKIAVYTLAGALVESAEATSATYAYDAAAGEYVVIAGKESRVVIVK